jgi:hypothetical protein
LSLDRDRPIVSQVLCPIHRRHAAGTQGTLDGVSVGKSCFQALKGVLHGGR